MNQTSLKEKSYSYDSLQSINDKVNQPELLKVAIYNNLKVKITHHRVIGDGCIWEGISPECLQSQSVVFYQVLNAGQ